MDFWTIAEWVGKVALVTLFALSGMNHLANAKAMTPYAQSKKVPMAGAAVIVGGLMMLAGTAMVLLRWHALWGCGLLVAFVVPTAFIMHNFWADTDPMIKANNMAHFLKNLAAAGGVILYGVGVHRGAW